MTADTPVQPSDKPAEPQQQPPVEDSPTNDTEAPQALRQMNDANAQGTAAAMRQIDQTNPFRVVDPAASPGEDVTPPGDASAGRYDRKPGGPPGERERTIPHTVAAGETLWSISSKHQSDNGTTATPQQIHEGIGQILEANRGLDPDGVLRSGQTLKIPESLRTGLRTEGRHIPGAPTALVLDTFDGNGTQRGVADTSHGGFLAAGFNAMGFNIVRGNLTLGRELNGPGGQQTGRVDFTPAIERAANYIEANRDQFPPGSFVNTSFGNREHDPRRPNQTGDLTYAQLSKLGDLPVTADSVGGQRDEILRRLEHVAAGRNPTSGQPDSRISKQDRELADAAVRTNQQIDRIQKMGVEVVHSAGNDGPNRIDINFLRATQLRSDGPDGTPLKFSGVGSHTEHGAGVYQFHMTDRNTVATDVNGYMVSFPITPGARVDRRDHQVNFDRIGTRREFTPVRPGQPQRSFDVEGRERGYAQRVYGLGPIVDYVPGTSFAPLSYIFRTRNIPRPPEP